MVAYSYRERFAADLLAGTKDQTIRADRGGHAAARWPEFGGHARPGQGVENFIGMRTRHCRLILKSVCTENIPICLRWRPVIQFEMGGELMASNAMDAFARRDGFRDVDDMADFWAGAHGGPDKFWGRVIRWRPPPAPVPMGSTVALPFARALREELRHRKERAAMADRVGDE